MKENFLEKQTKLLNEQKQEILEKLAQQNEELYKLVENVDSGDEVDMASDAIDRKLLNELGAQDSARLNQIEAALTRIKRGTYGICINCGEQIKQGRLEAIPYASLCIDCQEEMEKHKY